MVGHRRSMLAERKSALVPGAAVGRTAFMETKIGVWPDILDSVGDMDVPLHIVSAATGSSYAHAHTATLAFTLPASLLHPPLKSFVTEPDVNKQVRCGHGSLGDRVFEVRSLQC